MKEIDFQILIWNLMQLEKKLIYRHKGSDAYLVRQALDLLYPDWKEVTDYKEIKK